MLPRIFLKIECTQLCPLTNENKLKKFKISITHTGNYHYVCEEKRKIKYDGMHSLNNPLKDLAAPELEETNERGVWREKKNYCCTLNMENNTYIFGVIHYISEIESL